MDNLEPQTLFYIFGIAVVVLLIIAVGAGIFCVLMLRDCLKRDIPGKNKWVALITILNVIGALFYYFYIKSSKNKINKAS
ncbi:MAG: PLDc N-terminal domain-containing protein [bacterium]